MMVNYLKRYRTVIIIICVLLLFILRLEWQLITVTQDLENTLQRLKYNEQIMDDYKKYISLIDSKVIGMGGDDSKWTCNMDNIIQNDHPSHYGEDGLLSLQSIIKIQEGKIRPTTDLPPPQCFSQFTTKSPVKLMCSKFQWNYMKKYQLAEPLSISNSNNYVNTTEVQSSDVQVGGLFNFESGDYIWFKEVGLGNSTIGPSFGCSWGDFNRDGWPDLYVNNHYWAPVLYLNQGNGTFRDVAPEVFDNYKNMTFRDKHGSAWADYDKDGELDILEVTGALYGTSAIPNNHYRNIDGGKRFKEMSAISGLDYPFGRGRTVSWIDYDLDGHLDVFIATQKRNDGKGLSALFRQDPNTKKFAMVNDAFKIDSNVLYAHHIDIDNDGEMELFILSFTFPFKVYQVKGLPFKEVTYNIFSFNSTAVAEYTEESKRINQEKHEQQSEYSDVLDEDDETGEEDPMMKKKKMGKLAGAGEWIPPPSNTGYYSVISDTVFGDVDNNGWQDIILSRNYFGVCIVNIFYNIGYHGSSVKWLDWEVQEIYREEGVTCGALAIGDFDNDMDLDIYLMTYQTYSNSPNIFLVNKLEELQRNNNNNNQNNNINTNSNVKPQFTLKKDGLGAAGSVFGRGESVAVADYDLDGKLDLFITNGKGSPPFDVGPTQLFHNIQPANRNWIEIDILGKTENAHGFGGRIILKACGHELQRAISNGVHFASQDNFRVHFGLGSCKLINEIKVWWPKSNRFQSIYNIKTNQVISIVEALKN